MSELVRRLAEGDVRPMVVGGLPLDTDGRGPGRTTTYHRIKADMARRAETREPDPGKAGCLRCGSTDGVRSYTVRNPRFTGRPGQSKSMYDWERVDSSTADEFMSVTVCPCCSFDGCRHPDRDPTCPRCERPIAPEGKWATRCPVDGNHATVHSGGAR